MKKVEEKSNNHRKWLLDLVAKENPKFAIEVGVMHGQHAQYMLDMLPSLTNLHLIDCWEAQAEYESESKYKEYIETNYHGKQYDGVCEKFKSNSKVEIIKGYSVEQSKKYKNESVDFIYIDACHKYNCVIDDLVSWFPKLKHGGIIAGDDYCTAETFGVVAATDDFAFNSHHMNKNISEFMVVKNHNDGSWIMKKK